MFKEESNKEAEEEDDFLEIRNEDLEYILKASISGEIVQIFIRSFFSNVYDLIFKGVQNGVKLVQRRILRPFMLKIFGEVKEEGIHVDFLHRTLPFKELKLDEVSFLEHNIDKYHKHLQNEDLKTVEFAELQKNLKLFGIKFRL